MGAFIGPLGGLIEATQWQEKQSVSTGAAPSFFTGLDGARTAFVQPPAGRVLREWDVAMSDARPEQAAAFQTLALGGMGAGPFVFADPLAQVTNLLTPRQSLMDPALLLSASPQSNITPAVMVIPGEGSNPAGVVTSKSTAFWGWYTPVMPGQPLTLSLWVQGQAEVTLRIMRNNATWSNRHAEVKTVESTTPTRVSLTFNRPWLPDSEMCGFQVKTTASATIARPQITWTAQPMPWAVGRGASKVVVHGLKESFEWADPSLCGQRRLDYSATVTEVGSGA